MAAAAGEKRWAKRMKINAVIKLRSVKESKSPNADVNKDEIEVSVINISKGGIAFTSKEFLPLNSYYESKITLWTKESFEAIIQIIRMESIEDSEDVMYGCRFIGLSPSDQFKIDVYQIVSEEN